MLTPSAIERLAETGSGARTAEARGNDALSNEEWRRYRLIEDGARDPDELLAEGIALSALAAEVAANR